MKGAYLVSHLWNIGIAGKRTFEKKKTADLFVIESHLLIATVI